MDERDARAAAGARAEPDRRGFYQLQPAADRFANGFNDPADFDNFFFEPEKTNAYLGSLTGA